MATAYSGEVAVGSYNRIRLRVEYSGTSATCYMEFRRTSSYTGSWADSQASITFNGRTISAPYSYSGTVGTNWVQLCGASGFTVSTSGGTYSWTFNNPGGSSVLGCSGSITIGSQVSPPTDLSFQSCVAGPDYYDIGVSVSGWGTGGSSSQRYIEAQVWTESSSGLVEPRRYQASYNTTSATIRVNNSSSGSLDIIPNKTHTIGIYATNGAAAVGSTRIGNHVTAPPVVTIIGNSATENSMVVGWSFGNQGGAYALKVQLRLEWSGGYADWATISTQSGSGAKSGAYTISGLTADTTYTVKSRVIRDDNQGQTLYITNGNTITVKTVTGSKLYGKNPSKNLLNLNNGTLKQRGSYGYWIYTNTANSIIMTATGTTGAQYAEWTTDELDSTKTYTFSGIAKKTNKGTSGDPNLKIYHMYSDDGTNWSSYSEIWKVSASNVTQGTAYPFSFQESGHKYYRFYFYNNSNTPVTVGESSMYYDLQIEEGSSASSFVPYYGPQGTIRINKLYGKNPSKNQFNPNATPVATASNNIEKTALSSGVRLKWVGNAYTGNLFYWNVFNMCEAQAIEGQKVSVSFDITGHTTANKYCAYIGLCAADGSNRQSKIVQSISSNGHYTVTWDSVTYDSTRPYVCVVLYLAYSNSISIANGDYVDYTNVMFEVGNAATYTPYYGPQGTIEIKKLYGSVNRQTKLVFQA